MKALQVSIIFLMLACFLQSCGSVEGCNEPLAKNYNAEADKVCCCEYYQLRFDMAHVSDAAGTAFSPLAPYSDADGHVYQVKSAALLLSSVSLIRSDGTSAEVGDSILLPLQSSTSEWFADDFSLLLPGTFINKIGSFTHFGPYEKVRFLVGLAGNAATTKGEDLSDATNPLAASNSTAMYDSNSDAYNFGRWEIIKSTLSDTTFYVLRDTVWVELPYNVTAFDGVDTRIPIQFNYTRLFDGISFVNDDSTTVVQKIKNNTRHAFSIQ